MAEMSSRGKNLQQGEAFTLKTSGAVEVIAGATSDAYILQGERVSIMIMLDITASATAAGDTLDVYIDVLGPDATTWLNAVHFPQQAGNGAVCKYIAVLTATSSDTAPTTVTADALSGVVRPNVFGSQIRARWTVVDAGGGAESHTFAIYGYAI